VNDGGEITGEIACRFGTAWNAGRFGTLLAACARTKYYLIFSLGHRSVLQVRVAFSAACRSALQV